MPKIPDRRCVPRAVANPSRVARRSTPIAARTLVTIWLAMRASNQPSTRMRIAAKRRGKKSKMPRTVP